MNFSDQLKTQLNIVDVVGHYVRLKRQGAGPRWVGLCPFHTEKTPSFGVNSALQYYKCFGCDAAGDVFKFVMEHEHLTFPEALRLLADRYGIAMPERQRNDDVEAARGNALLDMHELAAEVFQENLRGASGRDALKYLAGRGVSSDAMREFRIGLADGSGQQLVQRLQRFGSALMEESGLVLKRQEGVGFFDRFRNRLMFPIHNESGKVIAFGGRALRDGDEPKYLNSPETRIYKKSAVLFNLHRAKIEARKRDRMVLVEGYMDVIGVYSAGVQEVVASSGTALSSEQVRAVKRQISQTQAVKGSLILNFDPDAAGTRSTEKHIPVALAEGLRLRVLRIPGGLDPDEYIQQRGPDAYRKLLDNAESYFHWLAGRAKEKFDLQTAEGRVDALKYLAPALQLVHDALERSAIIQELAENLRLERETIRNYLKQPKAAEAGRDRQAFTAAINPNEKLLVGCLLASREARTAIREYFRHADILPTLELREIFEAVLALEDDGEALATELVMERLEERSRRIFVELGFSELGIQEADATAQALHCLEALEKTAAEKVRDSLRRQIREAEQAGDLEKALRLTQELNRARKLRENF